MRLVHGLHVLLLGAGLAAGSVAVGQDTDAEEEFDRTPVDCLSMRQIQNTEILDNRTILFYRRGGRFYLNVLESDCPTLRENGLFRYRIQTGIRSARLCGRDSISVVDRLTNSLSYTCRLGPFLPIDEARAEELLRAGPGVETTQPVELPGEGDDEDAGEAAIDP